MRTRPFSPIRRSKSNIRLFKQYHSPILFIWSQSSHLFKVLLDLHFSVELPFWYFFSAVLSCAPGKQGPSLKVWSYHMTINPVLASSLNRAPQNVNDFRPISLCNVINKIIAKVVANKLKRVPNKIISPTKVPLWISNNYLVAHEMIHSLKIERKEKTMGIS